MAEKSAWRKGQSVESYHYNDTPAMKLTRPRQKRGTKRHGERISFIEGVQTGNPDWECDTMTIRLRQTPYGQVNGELYIEMLSFDCVDSTNATDKVYPTSSIALDEIGARSLINKLSMFFDMGYRVPPIQRRRDVTERPLRKTK